MLQAVYNAANQVTLFKKGKHAFFGTVPKIVGHQLINARIANNGKLAVFGGQVNKHAIALLGLVHLQFVKVFGGSFYGFFTTGFFYTNPYLPRSLPLSRFNSQAYLLLVMIVKNSHILMSDGVKDDRIEKRKMNT